MFTYLKMLSFGADSRNYQEFRIMRGTPIKKSFTTDAKSGYLHVVLYGAQGNANREFYINTPYEDVDDIALIKLQQEIATELEDWFASNKLNLNNPPKLSGVSKQQAPASAYQYEQDFDTIAAHVLGKDCKVSDATLPRILDKITELQRTAQQFTAIYEYMTATQATHKDESEIDMLAEMKSIHRANVTVKNAYRLVSNNLLGQQISKDLSASHENHYGAVMAEIKDLQDYKKAGKNQFTRPQIISLLEYYQQHESLDVGTVYDEWCCKHRFGW